MCFYGRDIIVIAHRGVAIEGILDYAHFSLFSGALAQFPGVLPSLMMIILIYMIISSPKYTNTLHS